ncbi:Uncharacterised protein [Cedecea lapagei]|uniref:DUF2946 domain-containing protein n=1 Tax=Cedecea lapagei TaxID=158823 RepID=A0A447V5J4_9ENTR|nr:Uncharacterised protein [Cedecea lapagei]
MLHTSLWSTSRWRFIRKHLLMLLLAFGWFFVNSQVAVASYDCPVDMTAGPMVAPHSGTMQMSDKAMQAKIGSPLCEKHCVPDVMQKDNGHSSLVALPVVDSLALIEPQCSTVVESTPYVNPPATGPPATIRFCRFRE